MADRYEHESMEPTETRAVLAWLYDGYGGHLSDDARERIAAAIDDLDDAAADAREADR